MSCDLKHCKCKPVNYTDGTPSREIDEDWEAAGGDEMNKLYDKIIKRTPQSSILKCRDDIINLIELLEVCRLALLGDPGHAYTMKSVSNTLYFQVEQKLKLIEEELASI